MFNFRLFDSQNNNRGGYNVGQNDGDRRSYRPMRYMAGSILPIEWTSQHSCGTTENGVERKHNSHCELIIQYMCSQALRDGTNTKYGFFHLYILHSHPDHCKVREAKVSTYFHEV